MAAEAYRLEPSSWRALADNPLEAKPGSVVQIEEEDWETVKKIVEEKNWSNANYGAQFITFEDAYRMALTLTVHMAGSLDQETADNLLERAKGICPYVDATKNNVSLTLKAVLDTPVTA